MIYGSAIVRRTPLAEKVYAKAAEMERERKKALRETEVQDAPVIKSEVVDNQFAFITSIPKSRIRTIQSCVAGYYGISVDELLCQRRQKLLCEARQVAMYLAKVHTVFSFPELGLRFGDRDHTTILHAVRKISSLVDRDEAFRAKVEEISSLLNFGA